MAEKKIGGRTFKVDPLLATEAIRLQMRLVKAIGPALSRLPVIFAGAGDKATAEAKDRSNAAAVEALTKIIGDLEPDDATALVKDIVEVAMVQAPSKEWRMVDLDGDFTGNLGEIITVATFVLREQFGDVFSAALANGRRAQTTGAH